MAHKGEYHPGILPESYFCGVEHPRYRAESGLKNAISSLSSTDHSPKLAAIAPNGNKV
ncbi:hypothetical protein WJR50_29655 [Catalinimonas sp. 4WD22]|uniref:hypothetical protein n=1 Tax=Catalinimonas locisalis TaxID=3133978 RepID=UPI0031011954